MARLFVDQGLQVVGQRASEISGPPDAIAVMSVDGGTAASNSFLATHTALSNGYGGTSFASASLFQATAPAGVSTFATFITSAANFTIGRIALHNDALPTLSSASLICGIDQQGIVKTSNFLMVIEVDLTYAST